MAKTLYCLMHIPSGTMIDTITFKKKSKGVAFLNSLPQLDGRFNPPHSPMVRSTLQLSSKAFKTYSKFVYEQIHHFCLLYDALHPQPERQRPVPPTGFKNYLEMSQYSPAEFDIVEVKWKTFEKWQQAKPNDGPMFEGED